MYQTPDNTKLCNQLAHDIKNLNQDLAASPRSSARLLLDVELGLYLAEKLNLALEPITVVWSLLCGISVLDDTLLNLDVEQQLALANSRMILGSRYSGRFSWEQALRDYIRYVPCTIRLYDYPVNQSLDNNLIDGSRRDYQDTRREEYYDKCLNDYLNFDRSNKGNDVEVNHEYYIDAQMQDNTNHQKVTITFSDNDIAIASKTIPLLSNEQRKRQTQRISLHNLSITAQFIDKREALLDSTREALLGSTREGKSWLARLNDIHYQMIDEDGNLSDADDIEIDGLMNLAGMVGSGKSTLATLIAAHFIHRWQDTEAYRSLELDRIPLRTTIVLGDVASCNDLADKINQWFCDNPESTQPVAVPLIGRTTRASHIKQFNESAGYKRALADDRIHSGERFLNPTCPLQAKLTVEQLPQPIIAGKEPCTTIMLPASKEKIKQAKLNGKRPPKPKPHLCPFFVQCPSQQIWHDMVNAQVWITTPAGMAQGALPRQMESRRVKIGDVIYEQSDLVIFDEADTVMDWFDRVYAQEVKLAAAGQGYSTRFTVNYHLIGNRTVTWMH